MYTAHVLTQAARKYLAEKFPPKYSNFIGHHVTLEFGVPKGTEPPVDALVRVIGYRDSGDGLEALAVMVDGQKTKPDGNPFHITWSIDPDSDYKPVDSNELIKTKSYTIVRHVPINTEPATLD